MLQIGREYDSLVASLAWKLNTKVPSIHRHQTEIEVLIEEIVLGELIESVDCVTERACTADMLPLQGRETRL